MINNWTNINKICLFFFIAFFLTLSANLTNAEESDTLLLTSAKQLYEQGEYKQSIEKLENILIVTKDKDIIFDIYFHIGLCNYLLGDVYKAKTSFEKAIELKPLYNPDTHIYSPKIVRIYKRLQDEYHKTMGVKSKFSKDADSDNMINNKSISINYSDLFRVLNDKNKESFSINSKITYLNMGYRYNKYFSLYLKPGFLKMGINDKFAKDTFTYGIETNINLLKFKKLKLSTRLEYLSLDSKDKNFSDTWESDLKLNETRAELTAEFTINSFSPYLGIANVTGNGELRFVSNNSQINSMEHKLEADDPVEYFSGIKILKKDYFFKAEMRVGSKRLEKVIGYEESFMFEIGRYY